MVFRWRLLSSQGACSVQSHTHDHGPSSDGISRSAPPQGLAVAAYTAWAQQYLGAADKPRSGMLLTSDRR